MRFRYNQRRTRASKRFSDIFDLFCEEYNIKSELSIEKLKEQWDTIVGPILSVHIVPFKIEGSVLYLYSDHSVYSNDIMFIKPKIIESISAIYEDTINDIKVYTKKRRR